MKKRVLVVNLILVAIVLAGLLGACSTQQPAPPKATPTPTPAPTPSPTPAPATTTSRKEADYITELKTLVGATSVGQVIKPSSNDLRYPFVPLIKDGKPIAYGSWVTNIIYNHPEDLIVAVNPDGTLKNFKALDTMAHHPNIEDQKWKSRFIGMNKDRNFDTKVDLATGSTFSTNNWFSEMKNILNTFVLYIKPNLK